MTKKHHAIKLVQSLAFLFFLVGVSAHTTLAQRLVFTFQDPVGDATGRVDIVRMRMRWNPLSGAYAIILNTTGTKPFAAQFRININIFNPDAPAGSKLFARTLADHPTSRDGLPPHFPFPFSDGDTEYILTGHDTRLMTWRAGDRVATSEMPFGSPPGFSRFRSAITDRPYVGSLGQSSGDDEIGVGDAERIASTDDSVLSIGQGGLPRARFANGAIYQDLVNNGILYVLDPLFQVLPGGTSFSPVFRFDERFGPATGRLRGAVGGNGLGGALGARAQVSTTGAPDSISRAIACGAVVHNVAPNVSIDFDGISYLFLRFRITGTNNSSAGGVALGQYVVGTNPFDLRTFSYTAPGIDTSFLLPFGTIDPTKSFDTIFGVVASAILNNAAGQSPTASAEADFLHTLTLAEVRITSDPEGTQVVPLESMTSDTGLVFRVESGVAIPLVGQLVAIDIKPGGYPNSINSKSNGNIPVAILSNLEFHAPQAVDVDSLAFGISGLEKSLRSCNRNGEDVNGDGQLDLVCHFRTQLTGVRPSSRNLILTGRTVTGDPIHGTDSVRMVH